MHRGLKSGITIVCCCAALLSGYNIYLRYSISQEEALLKTPELISRASAFEHDGRPPAFLLIHGFSNAPFDMRPVADLLDGLGYAYKAIQLPGHSMSARNLQAATMEQCLSAASSAYEELRERYGQVGIIGFSMGADLGLQIASRHEVSMLVVINPFFRLARPSPFAAHLAVWCRLLERFVPYIKKTKLGMINDPDGLRQYFAYWHMPLRAIAEVARLGVQAAQSTRKVTCTTLWVHSRADRVADFTASLDAFNALPARNKRFIAYERSDHTILFDYDEETLLEQISAFIQGTR
jgi:carboxylesterase